MCLFLNVFFCVIFLSILTHGILYIYCRVKADMNDINDKYNSENFDRRNNADEFKKSRYGGYHQDSPDNYQTFSQDNNYHNQRN